MKAYTCTFRYSAVTLIMLLFMVSAGAKTPPASYKSELHWKLNKNYRIEKNEGFVILQKQFPDGQHEEYLLEEFNADVVVLIVSQESMDDMINDLSVKYQIGNVECRRMLKRTINVLEEWDIVSRDRG